MSIFKYILPSGATFTVQGPAGATQAQSDAIFYSQVAAGTFAGYTAGQTLASATTTLTNFGLTRLQRGTAGVDTLPVLSIVSNLPTVASVPSFASIPLVNPVNQADVALANIPLGVANVGPLTPPQVQSLQAQVVNLVNQDCAVISQELGIGKFGLNCQQLEQTGYVKPGTTQQFLNANYATYLPNADNFVALMNSPGIWTGQDGVQSLDDLLTNCDLQSQIYTQLMQNSYDTLIAAGVVQPPVVAAGQPVTATVYSQTASNGGILSILDNTALLTGALAITPGAINLVGTLLSNTISSGNALSNIGSLISGAVTNIGNTFSNLTSGISLPSLSSLLDSSLTKTITGDLSALTLNATQFGTPLTSLWASSGGLNSITGQLPSLNSLTSQIPSLNSLTSQIPGLNSLTSQIPSLNSLTSQIPGLSSLTSQLPNLDSLTSQIPSLSSLTSQLPSLDSLTSQLPSLDSLTSQLPSLSSITDGLPSLSSLTDGLPSLDSLTSSLPDISSLTDSLGSLGDLMGGFGAVASFASAFGGGGSGESAGSLVSNTQPAPAYNGTINRSTVDVAVNKIIGSAKIPTPSFGLDSVSSANSSVDIDYAKNILSGTTSATLDQQLQNVASASGPMAPLTADQLAIQELYSRPLPVSSVAQTPQEAAQVIAQAGQPQA